jgi:hypothetical protein
MQVTYIPVVSGYDVLVHGEDGLCVDPHPRHLHNQCNHQPSATNHFRKTTFLKGKMQNVEELNIE